MIASFDKPDSERHLYFLLNNSFHLCSPFCSSGYKMAGLYSVHHKGKCRYVGQSQNLPSRLANHLSGAYSYADEFRIYLMCEYGFEDFYDRDKVSRKLILENNELNLIQLLTPIDNIISNYDDKVSDDKLFNCFVDCDEGYEDIVGLITAHSITILDDINIGMTSVDTRASEQYEIYLSYMEEANNG